MVEKKVKKSKLIIQLLLIFWAVIQLFPLYFMFLSALKTEAQIYADPWGFPNPFSWENIVTVWTDNSMGITMPHYFFNSFKVTVMTIAIIVMVSMFCGYALARYQFRARRLIFAFIVLLMAVPAQSLIAPIFLYFNELGLLNNHIAISLLYAATGLPLSTVLAKTNYETIPREIEEAAFVDGCKGFKAFWYVSFPMSRGTIATIAILNLTPVWSEFMMSSLLLMRAEMRTLPVAVSMYQGSVFGHTDSLLYAALSLVSIPVLIIYFIFQKQIVKGMSLGAIK